MNIGNKSVPRSKYVFECSWFTDKSEKHERCINKHTFNHHIDLLLPETETIPDEILSELSDQLYYLVSGVSPSWLLNAEFIEVFVRKGHLILNVTKKTYLELGLVGTVSKYYNKHKDKYVVIIALLSDEFKEGTKFRKRVEWCLEKWKWLFTFFITWQPHDPAVCSSSISSYMTTKWAVTCHDCCIKASSHVYRYLEAPLVTHKNTEETDAACGFVKYFEWLGAANEQLKCNGSADSYVNTYSCPTPHTILNHCLNISLKGFFTTDSISVIVNSLRNKLCHSSGKIPWVAMTVHGFQDSPVSWGQQEHGYFDSGDNFYSIVLFPDDGVWIYKGLSFLDLLS
ncbi:hypothetical protein LSH36_61g11028 [Paralvinella palmiformis]|uniref:Uncharacterized protein n=1 Tax=Paralvinella palmiformis TaxID=53620 RepID=A0AAD9K4B1_9ANNE|nr:hypothetical protein LSH36_61g11028 [Paralvinella palmiformis]